MQEETTLPSSDGGKEDGRMMGFGRAIKTCFKKYFSFEGCAARAEFWWYCLFYVGGVFVLFAAVIAAFIAELENAGMILLVLLMLFVPAGILPLYSALVRRMHDVGYMGFLGFIPIAGFVLSLLPSNNNSVYRTKRNIHPVLSVLGKVFIILLALSIVDNGVKRLTARANAIRYEDSDFDEEWD